MATAAVSGDARRHAAFERRRQQVLGQSPSRLPRWLSPSSAASSRLECWPRTRVRDASPRGSVLSARCLPDARTRRALAARCRGCRMLLARPTLPAGVRPKSFCATATLYSSERAWIHEKRGPPGGALFQQLGVFFTFRGPQNLHPSHLGCRLAFFDQILSACPRPQYYHIVGSSRAPHTRLDAGSMAGTGRIRSLQCTDGMWRRTGTRSIHRAPLRGRDTPDARLSYALRQSPAGLAGAG